MKMKTNELKGDALLWAVATIEGYTDLHKIEGRWQHEPHLAMMPPHREYGAMELWEIGSDNDWEFFGPIIERECITLNTHGTTHEPWVARMTFPDKKFGGVTWSEKNGDTPLIAAMRCYVASKLGDEIEIPDELKGE